MANISFPSQLSSATQNAVTQAYKTAAGGRGVAPILRYPLKNIDKSDDYLKIDVLEYVPPGLNTTLTTFAQRSSDDTYKEVYESAGTKGIRGTVILPIPEGISDSNSVAWGDSQMGPVQTLLMGGALDTIRSGNFVEGLGKSLIKGVNLISGAAKTGTTQKMVQQFAAASAVNQLIGGDKQDLFQTALARDTGAVFNENIELLFSGVSLRQDFTFSYDMVPRSRKESDEIKQIIRLFKMEMAARKGLEQGDASGLFLKSPSVFRLQYMSGGQPHPYLNRFKICALKGMGVTYTGSGTYATYSDATPVHMQMTMTFGELTPIYHEDYVDEKGNFKLDGTGY
jgi:hypothetical protein